MFQLFESIRIFDGVPGLIEFHQRRMDYSYRLLYDKPNPFFLSDIIIKENTRLKKLVKLKVSYSEENYTCDFFLYNRRIINSIKCVDVGKYNYNLKYTDRSFINGLRDKNNCYDDILMIKNDFVTDTSYCNIIFYDGDNWYVPLEPLFKGVQREFLIHKKLIKELRIRLKDISKFESFKLVNSMITFSDSEVRSTKKIHF